MKLLYSLLIILNIISLAYGQNCQAFLNKFTDPTKCYQVSISGVNYQSLAQEGYKGNLQYGNNSLSPKTPLINLQTYETSCVQGLIQPFYSPFQFKVNDFKINREGTVRLNGNTAQLSCNNDVATFTLNYYYYYLSIVGNPTCPKLYYGEECNTPTQSPTQTPTSTPTPTPTSAPISFKINYSLRIDGNWTTNGVQFYQYGATITNNESTAISAIHVHSNNWNPTEFWNMVQLNNGDLSFPSFVNTIQPGGTHSFGFVSSTVSPTFSTVSITRV